MTTGQLFSVVVLAVLLLSLVPFALIVRAEHAGLARPLSFLALVTVIYYVIPFALAIADNTASPAVFPIVLVTVADAFAAAGYVAAQRFRGNPGSGVLVTRVRAWMSRRLDRLPSTRQLIVIYLVTGILATVGFFASVGGVGAFFCSLDRSQVTTAGRLYLIWGMLLPKSAFLFSWPTGASGPRFKVAMLGLGILSVILVLLTGVRLFLLLAMLEAILIFHNRFRPLRIMETVLFAAALLGVAVVYGEYRIETIATPCAGISLVANPALLLVTTLLLLLAVVRVVLIFHNRFRRLRIIGVGLFAAALLGVAVLYGEYRIATPPSITGSPTTTGSPATTGSPTTADSPSSGSTPSFAARLAQKLTDYAYLKQRYTQNFVDALNVFVEVETLIPARYEYLHGTTYVRLLVQPIPRFWRPELPNLPPQFAADLGFSEAYGTVFQLWTEAYLNFGIPGVAIVAGFFGWLIARLTHRVDAISARGARAVCLALLITAMLLLYRGSFVGSVTLGLMDSLPVLALFVFDRGRRER